MNKLHFDYWMEISYTEPAQQCHYTFKCLPRDTDMQKIAQLNIEVTPSHDYQQGEDAFGNSIIYDDLYFPHDRFGFHIFGVAETGLAAGDRAEDFTAVYRYPHGLNRAGNGISAYFAGLRKDLEGQGSPYEKALYLMRCLHRDFAYEPGITNVSTTAEEAWCLTRGVCQDYAHILIALCHQAGIPARYVTGMMTGEGYSHAWVEALSDGIWYGLDPANGCIVGDAYIKIGTGRDAGDCMINKGIVIGGGLQSQAVTVRVTELP